MEKSFISKFFTRSKQRDFMTDEKRIRLLKECISNIMEDIDYEIDGLSKRFKEHQSNLSLLMLDEDNQDGGSSNYSDMESGLMYCETRIKKLKQDKVRFQKLENF